MIFPGFCFIAAVLLRPARLFEANCLQWIEATKVLKRNDPMSSEHRNQWQQLETKVDSLRRSL